MEVWAKKIPWGFVLLLAGALGQSVKYPDPICAVKGSTVTIPCSFTPRKEFEQQGRRVLLRIVRVVWCQNHTICHGSTPSVYDSNSTRNNPRYRYLGDLRGNCTLQIMDIKLRDSKSHHFRMEADNSKGHFAGLPGVNVTVIDGTPMRISSSSSETVVRAGGRVTLNCTAICSFHQLNVTWYRNGHALSDTGPALQLNPLTAADSGNYSCALKINEKTRSDLYSLYVEGDGATATHDLLLIVGVGVVLAVLAVLTLILVFIIIKRKQAAADKQQRDGVTVQKPSDTIYSTVLKPGGLEGAERGQATGPAVEEVSYATVQFKHKHLPAATVPAGSGQHQEEEAVVYSSVARLQ